MPGHKGKELLGPEMYDITEIKGADALYSGGGIIGESEKNASELFGSGATFYSCEGSSQCIKAMLYLAYINRKNSKKRPVILAARNAHKAFIHACALLDIDIVWLYDESDGYSLCRCNISPGTLRKKISEHQPFAVYVTSLDYLGGMADIRAIADTAHEFDIPLLADNAHGAYLKFIKDSKKHPLDCGADICCDSAHKTLPVLTGGAYLHISAKAKDFENYKAESKKALEIFGSTSPSYLILQSLDLCNGYIENGYTEKLDDCIKKVDALRRKLRENGYSIAETDPLKLTICSSGLDIGKMLRQSNIECEYEDPDFTVLMFTEKNNASDFDAVCNALGTARESCPIPLLTLKEHRAAMSVRSASLLKSEKVKVDDAIGRISALPTVSCPPAVPVVVSGEEILISDLPIFKHYGIEYIDVIKE